MSLWEDVSLRRTFQILKNMNKIRKQIMGHWRRGTNQGFPQPSLLVSILAKIQSLNGIPDHHTHHIFSLLPSHSQIVHNCIDSTKLVIISRFFLCKCVSILMLWVNYSNLLWNIMKSLQPPKLQRSLPCNNLIVSHVMLPNHSILRLVSPSQASVNNYDPNCFRRHAIIGWFSNALQQNAATCTCT